MKKVKEYFELLKKEFQNNADPEKGEKMSAYLKNKFKCYGITSPQRKEILKKVKPAFKWDRENVLELTKICWKDEYREIQYVGIDLLSRYKKKLLVQDLDFMEYLVVTHSWWDSVDSLASNPVGTILSIDYKVKIDCVSNWARSENIWLKRTAVLHQLKYRDQLDTEILEMTIDHANGTKEFFLNKAIGWALREYGKWNPEYVLKYCKTHEISNLSRKEALKNLKDY